MLTFFMKLLFGSTILLLAALILSLICRKTSATVRHRIWAGSLVGLLILPVVSPLLPSWSFLPARVEIAETPQNPEPQVEPEPDVQAESQIAVAPDVRSERFADDTRLPFDRPYDFAPEPDFAENIVFAPQFPRDETPAATHVAAGDAAPEATPEIAPEPEAAESKRDRLAAALTPLLVPAAIAWCVFALFLLLQLALSIRKVTQELSRLDLHPLTQPQFPIHNPQSTIHKSRRTAALWAQSDRAAVPYTCRVLRPVIVLPDACEQWSDEQRRAVFAHELAHVARNDVFWQVFSQIVCAIYWFHPLVWLAAYRIRVERELACDDAVLLDGEKPSMYAEVLLQLASGLRHRDHGLLGCMVAMARQHTVKTRIKAILNPDICRKQPGRVATFLMLLVAMIGIAFAATISPFAKTMTVEEALAMAEAAKTPEERIAIPADAPQLVSLKVRVLMPDGSPAKRCCVEFNAIGLRENPKDPQSEALGLDSESSFSAFSSGYHATTGFGEVSIDAPPGGNGVIYAYVPGEGQSLVSEPITFVLKENLPDMTITLREGIPLRGRVTYDDDIPAQGRTVIAVRQLDLLIGRDIARMKENAQRFRQEFQAKTDENGEYSLHLVPGEYVIRESESNFETNNADRAKTLIVTEESENLAVDLQLPVPIRGKITLPDGSVPEKMHARRHIVDGNHHFGGDLNVLPDGTFTIMPSKDNQLIVMTTDGKWGIIDRIPDDEPEKFHEIVLQPPAMLSVTFIDKATGRPLAGETFNTRLGAVSRKGEGGIQSRNFIDDAVADAQGRVTLPLPPGIGQFRLLKGNRDNIFPNTVYTLGPGETLELGTVEIVSPDGDEEGVEAVPPEKYGELTLDEVRDLLGRWETLAEEEKRALGEAGRALAKKESLAEVEERALADIVMAGHWMNQAMKIERAKEEGTPILTGRVLDGEGNPIPRANLNYRGEFYADDEGTFQIPVLKRPSTFQAMLILARGYAAKFYEVKESDFDGPIEIRLERGETVRVRVVNSDGSPIPEVSAFIRKILPDGRVIPTTFSITHGSPFARMITTDENGLWEMNILAEDKIEYSFGSPENSRFMNRWSPPVVLEPEEDIHEIVLPDCIEISGKLTDAETGEPVTGEHKIRLRDPRAWGYETDIRFARNSESESGDGSYRYTVSDYWSGYEMTISVEGYFPQSVSFRQEDGDQTFDIALKPDHGLSGTLLDASGEPVQGAVYMAATKEAVVRNGSYSSSFSPSRNPQEMFVNCDQDGHFAFEKSFEECHLIVTESRLGYAAVTREEFEANGNVIQLQPWGRVEVTTVPPRELFVELVPVEGQQLPEMSPLVPGTNSKKANFSGQAAVTSVFPGVKYRVKGYANMSGSDSRNRPTGDWLVAQGAEPVSVAAGETLKIELPMTGRPVRVSPAIAGIENAITANGMSREELERRRRVSVTAELRRTDDERVFSDMFSRYTGQLSFYTVEPGTYRLTVRIEGAEGEVEPVNGLYTAEQPIEVEEIPGGWSVDVLDLGEMPLGRAEE